MSVRSCFQKKLWHQGRIIQRFLSASHNEERLHKGYGIDDSETHFGFQTVSEKEKEERVYEVFHNVADRYDMMNDAMSVGIHRLWKDYFVHRLCPRPGMHLLDVAGGTGDIAFRFLRYVESLSDASERTDFSDSQLDLNRENHIVVDEEETDSGKEPERDPSKTHVTVVDINQSMLDVGKQRASDAGIRTGISWLCANAERLPLPDDSYDAYTIAFGIRNCTHLDKVLTEAHRVLKPGGKFFCLEFSHVSNPVIRKLYDNYSFQVIPVLGKIIAGDWHSYQYLVESIRKFPSQEEFERMIEKANFSEVKHENLSLGIAAIHTGIKS